MEEEIWKDVPGYDGLYQISISTREGKCRSVNYRDTGKIRVFSNTPNKSTGYIYWVLRKDGKSITQQAAVWIALTYPELVEGDYFPGATIDHKDTNRLNNQPSNIRWVTRKDNCNNPLTKIHMSESQKGKKESNETRKRKRDAMLNHPSKSKWIIKLSRHNEILHFYPSIQQASRDTGINRCCINDCCLGKQKTAGGYTWKYAEKEAV